MDTNLLYARRAALARAIRSARLEHNLTQAEVSTALDVPQSWVSNVESGARRLDAAELMALAPVLGVSTLDLITSMEIADTK